MSQFRWKDGAVVSLRLKDETYVLAQLLKSPYILFFSSFSSVEKWEASAAENASPQFFCAVTRQFVQFSPLRVLRNVRSAIREAPIYWIRTFPGSRRVTVWPDTPRERSFIIFGDPPGGQLIEKRLDARGFVNWPIVKAFIPLDDDETIDKYEHNVIWLYPQLNERLYLCKQLGRNVDPQKDLSFNRPVRDEYATFIDMLAVHGKPEDWGYSLKRSP